MPGKTFNFKFRINISKIKNDKDIAIAEKNAEVFPYLFKVCTAMRPAKKKSPRPRDIKSAPPSAAITGKVGRVINTGSLSTETCLAAETMLPVTKTRKISTAVKRLMKIMDVLHVKRLPR